MSKYVDILVKRETKEKLKDLAQKTNMNIADFLEVFVIRLENVVNEKLKEGADDDRNSPIEN